jgi:transposase
MVIVGVDAHKRTHTLVAIDETGRQIAELTVSATEDGHLRALQWTGSWPQRRFALEDCRHLTRRLEVDLLKAGEAVIRVPTRFMAEQRRHGRQPGKSDPIDALAVARAALREADLPVAHLDGAARDLRLLVDHRDNLVRERARLQNRLRWHLHELFPGLEIKPRSLKTLKGLRQLENLTAGIDGRVASITTEQIDRCKDITVRVNQLEREIATLVQALGPSLLSLKGCGALSAAKIIGETAGASRFRSKSAYARWNGSAPIPVWSGNTTHHRLHRGGNRQVNSALHRIAITQLRESGLGQDYIRRRMAGGCSKTEAIRLLRRRLSDVVFRLLLQDEQTATDQHLPAAA